MRVAIVGGGILGLAAARQVLLESPDADVVVLEAERALAQHQTGRNSGVVHAGLYYEPGSLKARLCRRGVGLLKAFCTQAGVAYVECGKVLVARDAREVERMRAIQARAEANGVPGLRELDPAGLAEIEPHARGVAALHSPTTAITDFAAVARALAADVEARGGVVRTGARVTDVSTVVADRVLVCAGRNADRLARASGEPAAPRILPFRGDYWALRPQRRHLVRGLVYPVPDPALPFLGVHLTRTVHDEVLVGPNAIIGLRDLPAALRGPELWRFARRHPRTIAAEALKSASRRRFVAAARAYVPELEPSDVVPAVAGVRAQAIDLSGALVDDFMLSATGRVVWVRNAPSPAATSSLAIAEELVARLR